MIYDTIKHIYNIFAWAMVLPLEIAMTSQVFTLNLECPTPKKKSRDGERSTIGFSGPKPAEEERMGMNKMFWIKNVLRSCNQKRGALDSSAYCLYCRRKKNKGLCTFESCPIKKERQPENG